MAITFIYPITVTPQTSLNYEMSDKKCEIIKNDSKDSLDYIVREKNGVVNKLSIEYIESMKDYITIKDNNITFKTISTGINCSKKNAFQEMEAVRKLKNPKNGNKNNLQYCIVQNFGTSIDPYIANEIGQKFAQEYLSEYQCVVSTHINTGYVHNHIEFNATSFVTGIKFHDCLQAKRDIRKVSDKLCEEYGLEVLTNTKEIRLIKYKDKKGKTRFYEPTDRKNEIINTRQNNYDANSYVHTEQHVEFEKYKESYIDIIKKDIERVLPYITSYEELLVGLKNIGYEIKDKTTKGEWREHISFKSPAQEKFTRDKALGEQYCRKALEETISKNISTKNKETVNKDVRINYSVVLNDFYEYGKTDINKLDEYIRYYKKNDEEYYRTNRSVIETYIVSDVKKKNTELADVMKKSSSIPFEKYRFVEGENKRTRYLINRINQNLRTLHFVEEKKIYSFSQIREYAGSLYEKRNAVNEQLSRIENALKASNQNIVLIQKYEDLKDKIDNNSTNVEYVKHEIMVDTQLLNSYENILNERKLLGSDAQKKYIENYNQYYKTFLVMNKSLEKITKQIKEYDDCVNTIKRIDKENGKVYYNEISKYYQDKRQNRQQTKKDESQRG